VKKDGEYSLKKLPIGIENFSEFSTENFYYIDKTGLIIDLLRTWSKVNLFTRPRRFGKSLNLDMLKTFFEIGCDATLFNGLKISDEKELCDEYMGRFPVISVTFKDVDGNSFVSARNSLCDLIGNEALRFQFLQNSDMLSDEEKKMYLQLIEINPPSTVGDKNQAIYAMSDATLEKSLQTLTTLLEKHYRSKVIIIIDEYDVPLDKAFQSGYYSEMVSLIRKIFSNALKTNQCLKFAVLTGCLRVSKESIFTGLNNFNVCSITDVPFSEYFGFTDDEVKALLEYYGFPDKIDVVKEWYDGYQFGNHSIYCPWDVINYCYSLLADNEAVPEDYWSNTSSNSIVRRFIDKSNKNTKDEIETLIGGGSIVKEIRKELTYSELDESIDNLWSVLFTTGYLTHRGRTVGKHYRLAIPNREIHELFVYQIQKWFSDTTRNDTPKLDAFCEAFPNGDCDTIEHIFNDYLWNTISVRDTAIKKERKENFYHGILLGLLGHRENWKIFSNGESGEGFSDILIEVPESRTGVVIELKYAEADKLEQACEEAVRQIENKQYYSRLKSDGMNTAVKYGIACYRKHCKVIKG
jgi:hypothetical protein